MKTRLRTREDDLREKIPTIADVPTLYRPCGNYLMIVPLPDQESSEGGIILTDRSKITYNEGHIVAMGPSVNDNFGVGDCVTWPPADEMIIKADDIKFALVPANAVIMRIEWKNLQSSSRICGVCKKNIALPAILTNLNGVDACSDCL